MKLPLAHLLLGVVLVSSCAAKESDAFTVVENLEYSMADPICRMSLYLPTTTEDHVQFPCVIVIQGGGFRAQTGVNFKPFAAYLAERGIAASLIGYRGQPDHTLPATLDDLQTATRYLRKISARHGIDQDRIGAMGRSAGATLAALLATIESDNDGADEHPGFSTEIRAVVGIAGVYDFLARFEAEEQRALQPNLDAKIISNGQWIGAPFSAGALDWQRASAVNHLDSNDPPMLLLHSRNDTTVPWLQSRNMYRALIDAGIEAQLHLAETGGHAGPTDSKARMVRFFHSALSE